MVVSVTALCRWCLVFVCVRAVEVVIGSVGGGAGGAIAGSVAGVVAGGVAGSVAGVLVVVLPGLCIVVELAAGAPGSALVLVVVVVCATAINGSAERAMARVGIRMMGCPFLYSVLAGHAHYNARPA